MAFRALPTVLLALLPTIALAHPHVWVDSATEVLFDHGRMTGVRHHWRFDEAFSEFASQGLDTNKDGRLSRDELQPLAKINVDSLKEYDFFTVVNKGDYEAGFADPQDYWLEKDNDRLILHFTLPLARPLDVRGTIAMEIYDPEYFVAFTLPNREAVILDDAPPGCTLAVTPGKKPDTSAAAMLATIGADQRELPDSMKALTTGIENSATVTCP